AVAFRVKEQRADDAERLRMVSPGGRRRLEGCGDISSIEHQLLDALGRAPSQHLFTRVGAYVRHRIQVGSTCVEFLGAASQLQNAYSRTLSSSRYLGGVTSVSTLTNEWLTSPDSRSIAVSGSCPSAVASATNASVDHDCTNTAVQLSSRCSSADKSP